MKIWLDVHLSPVIAQWIEQRFAIEAVAIRDLGFARARDRDVFEAARAARAILLTKDTDFAALLESSGPPPQIIWLTCGNTSNVRLKELLEKRLPQALALLAKGEGLIEIG